ncbi:MAG: crossover junction endodeoxyribonuclease RuvC [Candidatus Saccharibacteria bacterium]
MIILGIDPGIERTGYAILQPDGRAAKLLECGCITTSKTLTVPTRLLEIRKDLLNIIKKWQPELMSIESLFFATNAKTAMVVGQARGVLLLTAEEKKIPIVEVTPLQVKIAATGYGKAEKRQVQEMIKQILKLKRVPKPDDAADAAAIAWAGMGRLTLLGKK